MLLVLGAARVQAVSRGAVLQVVRGPVQVLAPSVVPSAPLDLEQVVMEDQHSLVFGTTAVRLQTNPVQGTTEAFGTTADQLRINLD